MAGIYIHVPFCRKACHYCDFHFSTSLGQMDEMVQAMCKELQIRAESFQNEQINTIYFGGGTPSLLSASHLGLLLETIHKNFKVEVKELTLEANPDDISTESLCGWKSLGINRLSIGLQTFQDQKLQWMNRIHRSEDGKKSVRLAKEAGFDNISLDLIYNIPESSEADLENDINTLVSLGPQHVSAYSLTIEPKTAFGKQKQKGTLKEVEEEAAASQFWLVRNLLNQAGFSPYEVSNFALPGKQALHNTNYWFQVPYLGIGPSAHGMIGQRRTANVANNQLYIKSLLNNNAVSERIEMMSPTDMANEMILTQLRTVWGLDLKELKARTGIDLLLENEATVKRMLSRNLVEQDANGLKLTDVGVLLADFVAMEMMV